MFGDEVFRSNNGRLDSDVEGEFLICYGEWFELEMGYEVGSGDDRSVNTCVRSIKGGVCVGVGGSVDWGFFICVVDRVGSDYGIKLYIHYGSDLVSSDG